VAEKNLPKLSKCGI